MKEARLQSRTLWLSNLIRRYPETTHHRKQFFDEWGLNCANKTKFARTKFVFSEKDLLAVFKRNEKIQIGIMNTAPVGLDFIGYGCIVKKCVRSGIIGIAETTHNCF